MAGGNIAAGLGLILGALVINLLVAFMVSEGATTSMDLPGCTESDNATTCSETSGTSFLTALLQVSFIGFTDNPNTAGYDGVLIVDGLYLLIVAGSFIIGVILFVAGIVGTPFGGG